MKIILKIFKYLFITLVVILALLTGLSLVLQSRITEIFTAEANRYTETKIDLEKISFSLIREFPKATVEFKNIRIESPGSSDPWIDSTLADNSFIEADFIFASFNIRDILKKEYTIDRITLKNCKLHIFKDNDGNSIKRIVKNDLSNDSSTISFDLKDIRLENTALKYFSNKKHFLLDCSVDNAHGRLALIENQTNIQVKTGFILDYLGSKDRRIINRPCNGDIDGELLISSDSIYFKQLGLTVDNQTLIVDGAIFQQERKLSLNILSDNANPGLFLDYISIKKDLSPDLTIEKLDAGIKLQFDDPSISFSADVNSFRLAYAGSVYRGGGTIRNLESPELNIRVRGEIDLDKLSQASSIEELESLSGTMHLNALLKGNTGKLSNLGYNEILRLRRSINLHLSDVTINLKSFGHPIQNISGNIMIAENAWADELSLKVAGQNFVMNGMIGGPNNFFLDNDKTVEITAGIWADKFDTGLFFEEGKTENARLPARQGKRKTENGNQLKDRINASLSINIDSLIIDKFRCSQFDGVINYQPAFLNISSFNLMALDGSLSGNAALVKNSGGTYGARGWFDIETTNITKAFNVFNNFGQEQIVAENIKGDLSGSLSIKTQLDSAFKLIPSSLSLTGNYSIYDGELINFEPILKLSRFIEVAELENIKFKDLHNDLLISDSRLMIPSMEINSSAFNISLSGEQDFSGDFEYHLSVLLSEILSKKARSSGSYISEFGSVEDDGLGRTTLFLKLEKEEEGTRVSYDVEKLSEEIKVSLQEEKQTLKTILNEEYGWYNNDSLASKTENSSRKFRITWEEADSVKTVKPTLPDKRPRILKKIFKSDTTKKKF